MQVNGDYVESWQPQPMSAVALAKRARHRGAGSRRSSAAAASSASSCSSRATTVWFSEVSPRPHDTGMVTMCTQAQSEFELHARAILGLPVDVRLRVARRVGGDLRRHRRARHPLRRRRRRARACPTPTCGCSASRRRTRSAGWAWRSRAAATSTRRARAPRNARAACCRAPDAPAAPARRLTTGSSSCRRRRSARTTLAQLARAHGAPARSFRSAAARRRPIAFRASRADDALLASRAARGCDCGVRAARPRAATDVRARRDGHGLDADHHRMHRRDRRHAWASSRRSPRSPRARCAARSTSRESLRAPRRAARRAAGRGARARLRRAAAALAGRRAHARGIRGRRREDRCSCPAASRSSPTACKARLGLDVTVSNTLEVADGRLTGRIDGADRRRRRSRPRRCAR